ncbi:hypothetical protein HDV05_002669 [Chytridiales sp. JEL 0842]|nr:hypothetical protein HDV05_002669 [Chytridiales sp. JEL 0842]
MSVNQDHPHVTLTSRAAQASLQPTSLAFAQHLDALYPPTLRSEFHFPKVASIRSTARKSLAADSKINLVSSDSIGLKDSDDCVYMIGNSLGLQPKRTKALLMEELDVWAERGVNGHFDHPEGRPWALIDDHVVEESAKIVGKFDTAPLFLLLFFRF